MDFEMRAGFVSKNHPHLTFYGALFLTLATHTHTHTHIYIYTDRQIERNIYI